MARRSKPMVDFAPCPGSTTVSSSSTISFVTIDPSRSRPLPPGRSVRPTDCRKSVSPVKTISSGRRRDPEHHRSAGVARRVIDGHHDVADLDLVAVAVQLDHLPGLAEQRAERDLAEPRTEALDRVGQHEPVLGMDVGRAAVGVGDLLRRPDVVDVPVGQQHRGGCQPVLVEDPSQLDPWPAGPDRRRSRPHPAAAPARSSCTATCRPEIR